MDETTRRNREYQRALAAEVAKEDRQREYMAALAAEAERKKIEWDRLAGDKPFTQEDYEAALDYVNRLI